MNFWNNRRNAQALIISLLTFVVPVGASAEGEGDDDSIPQIERIPQQSGLDRAELKRRRAMARAYFARQRAQYDVVATTVTDSGQVIDWIRPESQLANGRLASPPPTPPEFYNHSAREGTVLSGLELDRQPHARGPKGTVPMPRRDVDSVINNMALPDSIEDMLSKHGAAGRFSDPDTIPAPGDPDHVYASTMQSVFNHGGAGYINLWNPYVSSASDTYTTGEFSLGQIAVANRATGPLETVEAGWQDFPAMYGDTYPHLFIWFTTTGHERNGDYIGGYNRDVKGFVQFSARVFPGMRLTDTSERGGTQAELFIAVKKWGSNWWIFANGEWIGYYPASLFDSHRLGTRGTTVHWYGEVVDVDDGRATYTDMGSGAHAAEGYQRAAYMRNLSYYEQYRGTPVEYEPTSTNETDRRCYSLATYIRSGSSWGSYLFWGGPGRTSIYSSECAFQYSRTR